MTTKRAMRSPSSVEMPTVVKILANFYAICLLNPRVGHAFFQNDFPVLIVGVNKQGNLQS